MILSKKKLIAGFVALALIFSCVPVTAKAGGNKITIPVTHSVKGTVSSEKANIVIEKVTENAPLPKETTMQLTGNDKGQFDIEFNDVGRFDYKIREIEGGTTSTKYDEREYKVIVSAIFDENNDIQTSVVYEDGSSVKPESVAFEDESQANGKCAPTVVKKIKNNKNYKDKFTFKLEGEGKTYTTTVKGAGKASFPLIKYDKPGTYTYKLYEVKNHKRMWKYDGSQYTYKVTVTEKDGKITAKANQDSFTFTNDPTLLRKGKKLVKRVTDGSQTGDDNYLGVVAIVALMALAVVFVASRRKKEENE